jgi:nucleotide-binding universal stress UspA family protein
MRLLKLDTLLIATDLARTSDAAIETGRRLASAAGATLHVIHVAATDRARDDAMPGNDSSASDLVKQSLAERGVKPRDAVIHIAHGDPAPEIRALANRISADVIILGTRDQHDRDEDDRPLGGTAYAVVVTAGAPCLVVRDALRLPLERVLVPFDVSDSGRGALLVGLSWASALRARAAADDLPHTHLTALHVLSDDDADRQAETKNAIGKEITAVARDAGRWAGVSMQAMTTATEDTVGSIVAAATGDSTDLLVLGTRGRDLPRADRLGSLSAAVVGRVSIPVLLVPPAVWRVHGSEQREQVPTRESSPRP